MDDSTAVGGSPGGDNTWQMQSQRVTNTAAASGGDGGKVAQARPECSLVDL